MNKQEALVALLEVVRRYEEPNREVAAVPHEEALAKAVEAARNLDVLVASPPSRRRTAGIRETLKLLGGLALYALVDEVTVVEPKAEAGYGGMNEAGYGIGSFTSPSPAAYAPIAINGGLVETTRYVPVIVGPGGTDPREAAMAERRHRASCHGPIGELQCGGDHA